MFKNFKYFIWIAGVFLMYPIFFGGCTADDDWSAGNEGGNELGVNLYFSVPGSSLKTKAISAANEEIIEDLNVLVFTKQDNASTEYFDYEAPIKNQPGTNSVTVTLVRTQGSQTSRIVLIANADLGGYDFTGMTRDQVYELLTFDSAGKWNSADDTDFRPLPMWGETQSVSIGPNTAFGIISLLRSVVRIDVGINFNNIINGSEQAAGLSGYSLKSVYVYRTRDMGFLVPAEANFNGVSVIGPSVPAQANTNGRLDYPDLVTDNMLVRTVYVAESLAGDRDTATTLVVGIENAGNTTYYRINVVDSQGGFMPLLRNHRYVMNILSVSGSGLPDPDSALDSDISNIEWEVTDWDENINDFHVSGSYYIGFDKRRVVLEGVQDSQNSIFFQTNLADSAISFDWEVPSQQDFTVAIDFANSRIDFIASHDNFDGATIQQILYIRAGGIVVPVEVVQLPKLRSYSVVCSSVQVNGTYLRGVEVDPSNTITLTITGESADIIGYEYQITTPEIWGVSFEASGTFTSQTQQVTLTATGTPVAAGNLSYQIMTNSSVETQCFADAVFAYKKKKILGIGYVAGTTGYSLLNSASRSVMMSAFNFGTQRYSTVKVDGVEITNLNLNSGFSGGFVTNTALSAALANKPDIIVTGYYMFLNAATTALLKDYVENNNGILILFDENKTAAESTVLLFQSMFNTGVTSVNAGGAGTGYQINDVDDEIVHGPFGNLAGRYWGEDATTTTGLRNLPPSVIVYSTYGSPEMVTMFRYGRMFFAGDGGFLSNANNDTSPTSAVAYPFAINAAFIPVPNTAYTPNAYNSLLFANLMAWAIKEADYNGINAD